MESLGFRHFADQSPNHLALAAPDGRHWSRGELYSESCSLARGLENNGLVAGDWVAVLLPNCAGFIALQLAVEQLGCALLPLDPLLAPADASNRLRNCGARLFISHECLGHAACRLAADALIPQTHRFAIGNVQGFQLYDALRVPTSQAGTPDCGELEEHSTLSESDDIHYCGAPLHDSAVMAWVVSSLQCGHSIVLADDWDPLQILRNFEQYRVTDSYLTADQVADLQSVTADVSETFDLASVHHLIHGGRHCLISATASPHRVQDSA